MGEKYIHEFLNAPTYFFGFFLLSVVCILILVIADLISNKIEVSDNTAVSIVSLVIVLMFASLFWPLPYFIIWAGAKLFGWWFVSVVICCFISIIGIFSVIFGFEKMGDRLRYTIISVLLVFCITLTFLVLRWN